MSTYPPPSGDTPYGPPNSSTALISLISGIIGLSIIPVIGSIIAVVTGYMAKKEIRQSAGTLGGDGLATAGLVLGWIGIAMGVLLLCIFGIVVAISLWFIPWNVMTEGMQLLLPTLFSVLF